MKNAPLVVASSLVAALLGFAHEARAESCDPPRIMFVIDSSSSMLDEITEQGVTTAKWDAAQSAVKAVTDAYPDAALWGLMTFPGLSGGCTTGTVLVEPAAGTGTHIQTGLANITMTGSRQTPAGQTLMAAASEPSITEAGKKNYVIFVTDGWQYCSVPVTNSAPVCVQSADCTLMGVDPCPTCNACNSGSSDPLCAGKSDGCYCVRSWPVKGVQALKAAGVNTYVVGFGTNVDAKTLNAAADAGGTAIAGCDPTATTPSCFYKATVPSEFNAALADIVQKVVTETCTGDCGIQGTRKCTAAGWSDCDSPAEIDCQGPCGATGKQKCVAGVLSECDAVCEDAGAGGAAGSSGSGGAAGASGSGGKGGSTGTGGTTGTGGKSGSGGSAGKGGSKTDAGTAGAEPAGTGESGDDGGCGCRTAGEPSGSRALALLGLGLAASLIARRKRAS